MKIIHCADLHLDSRMTANLSERQAKERKMELLNTFLRMVDFADEQDVRLILIAGDLFDTSNVSAIARNTVQEAILRHPGIDFLYIKGNHDSDNFLSGLEQVPENLKLFRNTWSSYRYGNVVVTGIEWNRKKETTAPPVLSEQDYNIVMLHGQEPDFSLRDFSGKHIDYLALGHLHSYQEDRLDARGIYCYSGCLEGRGFDECGKKGFVLLSIDEAKNQAVTSFLPMAARTLFSLEVDVSGCHSSMAASERIGKALFDSMVSAESLVRIELTGRVPPDAGIDPDYLSSMYESGFFYVKVYDHTAGILEDPCDAGEESLQGEFIRLVQASDLPEDQKVKVIRCGIRALSGEDIL